ncbi:MAG: nicotinamide riboside transporter PnuC [Bacteroidales bacterium]|nr:nicotinamide riboside transporter PnuC [Bacteroidales bacterium]MCM1147869.1 nicotinamide riboside transporter PnuC [Bacteroidales bacterium]MCM1206712.1 nicotinamide riboside transporter PnuC [Bacillota bacterium]MCM1510908.1 nicotinamide riboside transporter PnuC [Clostridium sp.]
MTTYLDILGAVLGLFYLYLELKENILMWVAGAIMPVVYTIVLYRAGLYADCCMEFYYFLAAVYGFYSWRRRPKYNATVVNNGKSTPILRISHIPLRTMGILVLMTLVLWAALWAFLQFCTDSSVPMLDALTTALSVTGLWMLSRKYIEQWWVWLVVDAISSSLYVYKGIYARAMLYALYTVIAFYGFHAWRRKMKSRLQNVTD